MAAPGHKHIAHVENQLPLSWQYDGMIKLELPRDANEPKKFLLFTYDTWLKICLFFSHTLHQHRQKIIMRKSKIKKKARTQMTMHALKAASWANKIHLMTVQPNLLTRTGTTSCHQIKTELWQIYTTAVNNTHNDVFYPFVQILRISLARKHTFHYIIFGLVPWNFFFQFISWKI